MLLKAKNKVIDLAKSNCGILIKKKEENLNLDKLKEEKPISSIRDEKMHEMLTKEVYNNEDKWVHYDEEETEVGI